MKTIDKITSAAILATALGMVAWSCFTGPGQVPAFGGRRDATW